MSDMKTSTFAMIKPDVVERICDVGNILCRIEQAGFEIERMELRHISIKEAEDLYREHLGRPFYHKLIQFTVSGRVCLMHLTHPNLVGAVKLWRRMMGDTDPRRADPGSLRHDFGQQRELPQNAVHGSDSDESAKRELALFFK